MTIYYNAISKMHNKLEKELKISDKEYRDRFTQILLNHRKSYKILSKYVIKLDGKTFSNVRELSSQFEIPLNILSLFKLGLERHDRNSPVAIVTNNNKFKECVNQTENSPPVYIGNPFQLDPFYRLHIK